MRSATRLLMRALLLAILVVTTCGAILLVPAPRNTYMSTIVDKQRRLQSLGAGKIVIIGGSSTAFGVDSERLQRAMARPVVNTGLHAGLGMVFILDLVRPHVMRGDLLVLSPEYELFALRPDNAIVCRACTYLQRPSRYLGVSGAIRCTLLTSVETIQSNFLWALRKVLRVGIPPQDIYDRNSFNRYGDLVAHLNKTAPVRAAAIDSRLRKLIPDERSFRALEEFTRYANSRGAAVVFIHPSYHRKLYDLDLVEIGRLDGMIRRTRGLRVLTRPADSVYPDDWFFDTIYHLNGEARARRTSALIEMLRPWRHQPLRPPRREQRLSLLPHARPGPPPRCHTHHRRLRATPLADVAAVVAGRDARGVRPQPSGPRSKRL